MQKPFHRGISPFDAEAVQRIIESALASAGIDTSSGPMHDATETIRRALASSRVTEVPVTANLADDVVDIQARVVPERRQAPEPAGPNHPASVSQEQAPGSFLSHTFSNDAGSRMYKLYVPSQTSAAPRPVVVMLHGCTQSADDFALGTQMNRLADRHGFLVVYPEQPAQANSSRCWNWFKPQDQVRGAGEPSLIAGILREVAQRHGADPERCFVAGLSAGAAMAVVMGETYPELFAAVGAHSGLPYGSARDIPSALAAMKGGRSGLPGVAPSTGKPARQPVPTIVFHGDRDHTVQASNGEEIVKQAKAALSDSPRDATLTGRRETGSTAGGRSYTRSVHSTSNGHVQVESWVLHGAGHAWSGGDTRGSYTDGKGPDASAEMLRFFLEQRRGRTA